MQHDLMNNLMLIQLTAVLVFSGCATSPIQPDRKPISIGDVVRPVLATGAGLAAGDALSDGEPEGQILGGIAGLVSGLVWNGVSESQRDSAYAEGYAQGLRDAETDTLNQYWETQTQEGTPGQNAVYPNGQYEGVDRTPEGSLEFPSHTNIKR
jgi:hypothetical protein